MHWWFALGLWLLTFGCNATCLRDSDCMGTSICRDNRCLLIVRSDAGASGATSTDTQDPVTTTSDADVDRSNDAGSVN